jgi:hypothetical protein
MLQGIPLWASNVSAKDQLKVLPFQWKIWPYAIQLAEMNYQKNYVI